MQTLRSLLRTDDSWILLFQRMVLATVIFPHGAQKLFGWFGGSGFADTIAGAAGLGVPALLMLLVILVETVGAVALAFGALTRFAAAGIAAVMVAAVLLVHWQAGFFMDWSGQKGGEGFEYHLLALAIAIPLIARGAGRYSLDRVIVRQTAPDSPDCNDPPVVGRRVTAELDVSRAT